MLCATIRACASCSGVWIVQHRIAAPWRFTKLKSMATTIRYSTVFFALLAFGLQGCYTFKGISIDPNIKTFFIRYFETTAVNAPPTLAVDFTERLKDKVRTETPLKLNSDAPDAEFEGKITDSMVHWKTSEQIV